MERLQSASLLPPTRQPTYAEMAAKLPAALMVAKFVCVRRCGVVPPLEPLYLGPYQVLDNGPKVFRLAIGGRAESVSIDRLKPHLGTADVVPQRPPLKGTAALERCSVLSFRVNTGGGQCGGNGSCNKSGR